MGSGGEALSVVIFSRNFFGAERRFFRIVAALRGLAVPVDVVLVINSSLLESASRVDWAHRTMEDLRGASRLVVIPDRISHLPLTTRIHTLPRLLLGRLPMHALLRAWPVAVLRSVLGLPTVYEFTSPVGAERYARSARPSTLRRLTAIRCLTPTIEKRLMSTLRERRLSDATLADISARVHTASSPYFDSPADGVDFSLKRPVVASASRFIPRKNVLLIAQALAEALPRMEGWSAAIMGKGEDEPQIREVLADLMTAGRVSVGYRSDVEEVLRQSSVYVSLIEPDNYPSQGVLEAMNYGNALLLGNSGDSGRFIGDSPNGTIVDLELTAVVEALIDLSRDRQTLEGMGKLSQARIATAFAPAAHIRELLGLHGLASVYSPARTMLS